MRKLNTARNADSSPLGAVLCRKRSQARQTRYDEELAAIAGSNQMSTPKIIHPPWTHYKCTTSTRLLGFSESVWKAAML